MTARHCFDAVKRLGLELPGVQALTKYDGTPVLKIQGCFVAGLATHRSAEPDTVVVRFDLDDRQGLMDDAPETYYLTDYYRPYPLILIRLGTIADDALRGVLSVSRRLAMAKARPRRHKMTNRSDARR
jgi:hypothetical protein